MIIGQVLTSHGIITDEQLKKALDIQKIRFIQKGQAIQLGIIIVELGYATEQQIIDAVNEYYNLSVSSLSENFRDLVSKIRGITGALPRPRIPIWLQLSVTTMLGILVAVSVLSIVVLNRQKDQLYDQAVKVGLISLNYFDSKAKIPLIRDDLLDLNALIKNAEEVEGVNYAIITNTAGIIKAHTKPEYIGTPLEPFPNIQTSAQIANASAATYQLPNGKTILNLTRPVIFNNKKLGEVHVGLSIDLIQDLIDREQALIMGVTAFIVCFAILLAMGMALRFSRPISKLVTATQQIGKGNYQYRVPMKRNDELGNLAKSFNRMGDELFRQSLMKETFGKYVGREVVDLIMANPENTWLKGYRNEATIFFADIRGFTSYADNNEPETVVEKLNEFFEISTQAILKHDGYIDKFMGDSILGVFGVPVFRSDHKKRAVEAALELQKALKAQSKNGNPLLCSVGIGIDSGIIVSGNIGSQIKMEYTVIGDTVNVASRLSDLAGSGEILISSDVMDGLGNKFIVESRPPQPIKGKPDPVETYNVIRKKGRRK